MRSMMEKSTAQRHYNAGAQRVAMREDGTLYFLLSDHLGSTSLTLDSSGNRVAEMRFTPWGESRYTWGNAQTDYTYTGQRSRSYIKLMWYGSRWYDPVLGRFIQPDVIVPGENIFSVQYSHGASDIMFTALTTGYYEQSILDKLNTENWILQSSGGSLIHFSVSEKLEMGFVSVPINAQVFDRYSYSLNNPIKYVDTTGHFAVVLLFGVMIPVGVVVTAEVLACIGAGVAIAATVDYIVGAVQPMLARGGAGGAVSAAQHLTMLTGFDIGFGTHPGMPDPEGRDKNKNVRGLRDDLKNLLRNVRKSGNTLKGYLQDQGWTQDQIKYFIDDLQGLRHHALPVWEEYEMVNPRVAQDLVSILDKLGIY